MNEQEFEYLTDVDMKRIILCLTCAMLLACNNNKSQINNNGKEDSIKAEKPIVLSAEDVYKKTISKVAMIISYKDGVPYAQGSGFFIGENTLITNFHCVAGADKIEFKITGDDEIYKGAKVIKTSDDYDLAIIKTKQDFPYVKIDSLGREEVGSKVYAIGNPRGLEGTISDGILSGKRDNEGIEYLQITAPISPGNSGGPVLNEKGDVIGVATFTFRNSQSLNFAMPIKYIYKCSNYEMSENKLKKHSYSDKDNAVSVAKFSIVSHYDPCRAFVSIRNNTEQDVSGIMGQMILYDSAGEMYDYFDFKISETISSKMTKQTYIAVGDDRIHPNQYWGVPVQLNYRLSGTPKAGVFRFSHSGSSSDYEVNQAKTIEIRIIYFDLDE